MSFGNDGWRKITNPISAEGVEKALMKNMRFVPTCFTFTGINDNPEVQGYLEPIIKEQKKEKETHTMTLPEIGCIYYNMDKMVTTVVWKDKTSTTVRPCEGEIFDRYNGFCACVVKKLFGSTSAAKKIMNANDHDLILKKKAKEKAERRKEQEETAKANHDLRIQKMANRYRDHLEAITLATEETTEEWAEAEFGAKETTKAEAEAKPVAETEPAKDQEDTQALS